MSTFTHESMTNHHGSGVFAQLSETFHIWRQRQRDRRQLAELTHRDLHDVGCPGATSFTRPKSRFGGHERSQAGVAFRGAGHRLSESRGALR